MSNQKTKTHKSKTHKSSDPFGCKDDKCTCKDKTHKSLVPVKCKEDKCACKHDNKKTDKIEIFDHKIQLELRDYGGFPVPNTQFWVKLNIRKQGNFITIQLPAINFQTGQSSGNPSLEGYPVVITGGYLYTASGFLPCELRPNDIINRSYFGPSNNGTNLPFSFDDTPSTVPQPGPGYLIQIDNAGALIIQGIGTFSNIIPPGYQNLLPTTISYLAGREIRVRKNIRLSEGLTNTTLFSDQYAASGINNAVRDTHVNDAYAGIFAWAWSDNSNADQTQTVMNMRIAIAKLNVDGKPKIVTNQFLTNFIGNTNPGPYYVWDTAIAINRTNINNIVASFGIIDLTKTSILGPGLLLPWVGVSNDGGLTWKVEPMNVPPTGGNGSGDNRGISADKYGNFWYSSTNAADSNGVLINQPYLAISTDGLNWSLAYTAPYLNDLGFPIEYDFPQTCFGGDGQGNYGIWLIADSFPLENTPPDFNVDTYPFIAFIPITGLGLSNIGTPQTTVLPQFLNNVAGASITASSDGRFWNQSDRESVAFAYPGSTIINMALVYKSPGPITDNYAGPWDSKIVNEPGGYLNTGQYDSQPDFGMFNSPQNIIYDDKRQALYSCIQGAHPYNSQNDIIQFFISRNNGQSWSNPINIANSDVANRGFQSIALDTITGNLAVGWYDGRNDPNLTGLNYYVAIIDSKTLDKLVAQIPLSNPIYSIPASTPQVSQVSQQAKKSTQKRIKRSLLIRRAHNLKLQS